MIIRGSSFLLAFLASVLLARYIGIGEFGLYSEALAWSYVVAIFGTVGLDRFAVREIAGRAATNAWSSMHGLVRYLPRFALTLGCLAAVVAITALLVLRNFSSSGEAATFLVAVLIAPIMTLSLVRQGVLQGLGRVVLSTLPEDLIRPSTFITAIFVGFGVVGLVPLASVAMGLQAGALVLSFLVGAILLRRSLPLDARLSKPKAFSFQEMRGTWLIGVYAIANVMLMQAGVVLLGLTSSLDQVALFATSFKIAIGVGLAEYAVNNAYQPMVASRIALEDSRSVERLAPRAAGVAFLLAVPLAVVVFFFSGTILNLFGPGFAAGETTLRILCVSYAINPLFGQNGTLLAMSRNVRPLASGTAVALGLYVILTLTLSSSYGAEGAAWAWLATIIFFNGLLGIQVRRTMGFWGSPLVLLKEKGSR